MRAMPLETGNAGFLSGLLGLLGCLTGGDLGGRDLGSSSGFSGGGGYPFFFFRVTFRPSAFGRRFSRFLGWV